MLSYSLDIIVLHVCFFFFNQKTAYEMRISDWSSDVCSSDLFNASLDGNTRRAIDVHDGDRIDEKALTALVRAAVALNLSARAAGGPARSRKRLKRSEERRVGKECASTCQSRGSPYHNKTIT